MKRLTLDFEALKDAAARRWFAEIRREAMEMNTRGFCPHMRLDCSCCFEAREEIMALRKALSDLLELHEDEPERPAVANALEVISRRVPVIINAKTVLLEGPQVSYSEIVSKVFPSGRLATVTYCKGPWVSYEGTLNPDQWVKIKDGMTFSVAHTGSA